MQMSYPEAVATVVMSSQKSAPVAITVISNIAKSSAASGLMAIPCVVSQITQIFVGSALAPLFAKKVSCLRQHGSLSLEWAA
jgi:solute carrier family 10 (sodium/bile acid cotransporter), member 7